MRYSMKKKIFFFSNCYMALQHILAYNIFVILICCCPWMGGNHVGTVWDSSYSIIHTSFGRRSCWENETNLYRSRVRHMPKTGRMFEGNLSGRTRALELKHSGRIRELISALSRMHLHLPFFGNSAQRTADTVSNIGEKNKNYGKEKTTQG